MKLILLNIWSLDTGHVITLVAFELSLFVLWALIARSRLAREWNLA
jgi:hypothetical protein